MDTENPELGFCFTWTVHNFSTKKDLVRSPKYIMGQGSEFETHWLLGMYPDVIGKDHHKYVSLYLSMESCNRNTTEASYTMSIINNMNMSCKTRQDKKTFKSKHAQGFMEYTKRSELLDEDSGLLVNDRLKIICEIVIGDCPQVKKPENMRTTSTSVHEAYNEYWQLYIEKRLVDTTITVKTTEFQVHRLVLAAHSQVFESMFSHNMIESSTSRVTIEDCEPEVFAELLRFVYTKRVDNVKKIARGLLVCADKYDLEQMKKVCETAIGEELTKDNAAEIFILADTYNAVRLKSKTLDYISSHAWSITQTEGWSVMLHHPKLLNEVLVSLARLSVKTSRRMFEERRASGFFLPNYLPK